MTLRLVMTLSLIFASTASLAWAGPVAGVEQGSGTSRLTACVSATRLSSQRATSAADTAQHQMDARTLVTAEIGACECEEPAAGSTLWMCMATWRLVAMPVERH